MSAVSPLQPVSPEALPNYEQEDVSAFSFGRRHLALNFVSTYACRHSSSVAGFGYLLLACAMDHEETRQDNELFPEGNIEVLSDLCIGSGIDGRARGRFEHGNIQGDWNKHYMLICRE